MAASKLEDLDVTKQELDSIGEALKSEEFRKLLCEYVDEINDPENRATYEREIAQYESERGTEVTFIRPTAGYVVKTSADGVRKVFVNICSCDVLQKPTSQPGDGGDRWSLPHCISPVRKDYDKAHKPCDVYDVIFHPDVLKMTELGKKLKDMVEDSALSMIEKNFNVILDKTNLKYPKISFKGVVRPLIRRIKIKDFQQSAEFQSTELPGYPYQSPIDQPVQHHDLGVLKQKSLFTVPNYTIKYRSDVDIQEHGYNMHCKMNAVIPKELIVEIHLPLLNSSVDVVLDVLPRSLKLICHKPSKYKLDINLPYSVLEDEGNATFDQSTKKLIVCLPVVRTEPSLEYQNNFVSEIENSNSENSELDPAVCSKENCGNELVKDITMNSHKVAITNDLQNGNNCNHITVNNSNVNAVKDDVHYKLPEHEFIFDDKCLLMLNVKNVDPKSINVIVINDKNLISGKFHSIGSGFFPIWFAFCLQIPSKSSLLKSDVKVLPSNENLILEFSINSKPNCKQYWYGLDQNSLTIQCVGMEMLKENSEALANGVSVVLDDSDDDGDDDEVFDDSKEEIEPISPKLQNNKKNKSDVDSHLGKDKNGKTNKERGKKKKGKKIQKSNAIPIIAAGSLPESGKKIDFIPGSLPTDFNTIKPVIVGIYFTLFKNNIASVNLINI